MPEPLKIIGLVKTRNNGALLKNCLDHAFNICDHIIVLDDASTDLETKKLWNILPKLYARLVLLENKTWEEGFREPFETIHRQKLLDTARELFGENIWLYYFDADECIINPQSLRFRVQNNSSHLDGIKITLFDAHATPDDCEDYKDNKLLNFRKWFDPIPRHILMLWKNKPEVNFIGIDKREPEVRGRVEIGGFCQHYGKALSKKLWEEKCDYYVKHFSKHYQNKWQARKGKYIHTTSDFGKPLQLWKDLIN